MLSDTRVKSLKPKEKLYRVLDGERLYIEVRPSGKKIWRLKFIYEGKEGSISFGEYPAVSLSDARRLKDDAKEKLAKGINPVEQKRKEIKAKEIASKNTFRTIAEEYIEKRLKDRSEKYQNQFKESLERDAYKVIGDKEITKITSADILQIMQNTIKRVQSQDNHGTGEFTATNNRKFIGAVIRYAIVTLRADYDPTFAVRGAIDCPEIEHARPLELHEAKLLRVKLDNYVGTTTVKNAILALMYSMLRGVEVRRMQWSFVDFDAKLITFPIASKRTGQTRTTKKNRIHLVPMSDQLFKLLKEQFEISGGGDLVFPTIYKNKSNSGMLSGSTLNKAFKYIGLDNVSAHDFRATASTLLNEKGYDENWIEKQLAHASDNKTRASYNHAQYLSDRREMMQWWANHVDSWKD